MHNKRLKRIAKFLGTQGLYKEASTLAKVAQSDPETYEEREEAYRAEGQSSIKKDLVSSAIKKGITEDEVAAIYELGIQFVKEQMKAMDEERMKEMAGDEEAHLHSYEIPGESRGELPSDDRGELPSDDINDYIIPG